jgi:hypothetical protein
MKKTGTRRGFKVRKKPQRDTLGQLDTIPRREVRN